MFSYSSASEEQNLPGAGRQWSRWRRVHEERKSCCYDGSKITQFAKGLFL